MIKKEKNMPYFSIIVPIYNVASYLKKCIESILIQDYINYELILVDDGSTDESGKICDLYAKKKNIKVIHQSNAGLAAARNTGIKNAKGEWLIFIDSDDYIGNVSFLKNLYNRSINKDVVIYGCSQFVDETNKVIRNKYKNLERINSINNNCEQLKYLNSTNNVSISAWTHAVRKKFIIDNKLFFDEKIKVAEDIDWFFRLMLANPKISALDGFPYYYRIRQDSLSKNRKDGFWNYRYNAIKLSEKYINNSSSEIKIKKELLRYLAYQYLILLKDASDDKNKKDSNKYHKLKDLGYLLKYGKGIKNTSCRIILKIFGVKVCIKIISSIKNMIDNVQKCLKSVKK